MPNEGCLLYISRTFWTGYFIELFLMHSGSLYAKESLYKVVVKQPKLYWNETDTIFFNIVDSKKIKFSTMWNSQSIRSNDYSKQITNKFTQVLKLI